MTDSRDSGLTPTDVKSVATPGRRSEVGSDAKITARLERPGSDATPPPLPPSPAAEMAARWLERTHTNPAADLTPRPTLRPAPTAPAPSGAPAWVIPVLLAVTMLVVGIVIGALLFGHRGKACPPTPSPHGAQGSASPTSTSRAAVSTALHTATVRLSA